MRLVDEAEADLVLHVSNQSFDDEKVRLTIAVDGVTVVDGDFAVADQHNWVSFPLGMSPGVHEITAKADSGATLRETFEMPEDKARYAVIDHWGEDDSAGLHVVVPAATDGLRLSARTVLSPALASGGMSVLNGEERRSAFRRRRLRRRPSPSDIGDDGDMRGPLPLAAEIDALAALDLEPGRSVCVGVQIEGGRAVCPACPVHEFAIHTRHARCVPARRHASRPRVAREPDGSSACADR